MRCKALSLIVLTLGLSACQSMLTRSPRSGYYDPGYEASVLPNFYQEKANYEQDLARQELGYSADRVLTEEEQERLMLRLELNRLERNLESQREKKQYYTYKSLLANDRERIYLLRLPHFEARQRWLRSRGINPDTEEYSDHIAELIEKNDITLGMSQKAVTEAWGDPDVRESAGNEVYGNERWKYSKIVSTANGYSKEIRIVYFEAGRVVGWERQ